MGFTSIRPTSVAGFDFEYMKGRVIVWRNGAAVITLTARGLQAQIDAVYDFLDRVID